MRKIAATYIYPLTQAPIKNGILVCDDNGAVIDIIDKGGQFTEEAGVEFYSGIIVPGFVHENCNLLNHEKVSNRKMWAEGIVLAVDYGNSVYVIPERNGCDVHKLDTSCSKLKDDSGFGNSQVKCSFLERMIGYQENKKITLTEVFKWVSLKPVKVLGFDSRFGSFETGKTPGVNLISGIDFQRMELRSTSKVKRLI